MYSVEDYSYEIRYSYVTQAALVDKLTNKWMSEQMRIADYSTKVVEFMYVESSTVCE